MDFKPVIPFEPVTASAVPQGEDWISQIKWDGVRMLTYYEGSGHSVQLFNRKRNERTMQYPELLNIEQYAAVQSVILDGEIIALENGKPSFHQVMRRDGIRKPSGVALTKTQVPVTYMVFDLLYLNGQWVIERPLQDRRQLLEEILRPHPHVQPVDNHPDAAALFQVVQSYGMEGIVMKDPHSAYGIRGKDGRWLKLKAIRDLNAVVGGVTYRAGTVNALMLGLYNPRGELIYIGHAGSGKLTQADWQRISEAAAQLRIRERPFVNRPERMNGAEWIRPLLTFKINYLEWTVNHTLRQPTIQAFVTIDPAECTFGQS